MKPRRLSAISRYAPRRRTPEAPACVLASQAAAIASAHRAPRISKPTSRHAGSRWVSVWAASVSAPIKIAVSNAIRYCEAAPVREWLRWLCRTSTLNAMRPKTHGWASFCRVCRINGRPGSPVNTTKRASPQISEHQKMGRTTCSWVRSKRPGCEGLFTAARTADG